MLKIRMKPRIFGTIAETCEKIARIAELIGLTYAAIAGICGRTRVTCAMIERD